MSFDRLTFTKRWTSAADFPTYEASEAQVRSDMQFLHDETKQAVNKLMTELESAEAAGQIGCTPSANQPESTVGAALDYLGNQVAGVALGSIPDGSLGETKLTAELRQQLVSGQVTIMNQNAPTAADNVAAGYVLGRTWCVPGFTAENLLTDPLLESAEDWSGSNASFSLNNGMLQVSGIGSSAVVSATANVPGVGTAGDTIYAFVKVRVEDIHAVDVAVSAGGAAVSSAPVVGQTASFWAQGSINSNGAAVLDVAVTYEAAALSASGVFYISTPVIVNATALTIPGVIDITSANLQRLVASNAPFAAVTVDQVVYRQITDGVWENDVAYLLNDDGLVRSDKLAPVPASGVTYDGVTLSTALQNIDSRSAVEKLQTVYADGKNGFALDISGIDLSKYNKLDLEFRFVGVPRAALKLYFGARPSSPSSALVDKSVGTCGGDGRLGLSLEFFSSVVLVEYTYHYYDAEDADNPEIRNTKNAAAVTGVDLDSLTTISFAGAYNSAWVDLGSESSVTLYGWRK